MDQRVLHSPSSLPLTFLFSGTAFLFSPIHTQIKRKSFKKIDFTVIVLFIGYKKISFYFQKGIFLVSVSRKSQIKDI